MADILTNVYLFYYCTCYWSIPFLDCRRGRNHMVFEYTTTYAISAYHH